MIKKLIILIFILTQPTLCYSALQADAQWEVRTTGNNLNGSCYDQGGAGTDYSQQDAAQLTLTDAATSGVGVTTLTSATGGFTSEMADNCIYLASGTNGTVGYYEITVFTDTNTVTLDRAPDDAVGGLSGGNVKVGGGAADYVQIQGHTVTSNTVWIKAGTYTQLALNTATQNDWRGYLTTHADKPTGTDRPLIDCDSVTSVGLTCDITSSTFRHIRVANCTTDGIQRSTVVCPMANIKSSGNTDDGYDDIGNASNQCFRCEFNNNGGEGVEVQSAATSSLLDLAGSYLHDNSSNGIESGGQGAFLFSVAFANAQDGVEETAHCVNSISHANTGASTDGFGDISANASAIFNCIAKDNGRYGFQGSALAIFDYNGYHGNSTAGLNGVVAGENDLTADPLFTDAANGDFTLQASSTYIGAGFPGSVFAGITGNYKVNIGPDQDDNTVASGGASSHTFS